MRRVFIIALATLGVGCGATGSAETDVTTEVAAEVVAEPKIDSAALTELTATKIYSERAHSKQPKRMPRTEGAKH